jgi:hypothetical protein
MATNARCRSPFTMNIHAHPITLAVTVTSGHPSSHTTAAPTATTIVGAAVSVRGDGAREFVEDAALLGRRTP